MLKVTAMSFGTKEGADHHPSNDSANEDRLDGTVVGDLFAVYDGLDAISGVGFDLRSTG